MSLVTVIIPVRKGGDPYITLRSLAQQTFRDFNVIISHDPERRGHAWALNQGIRMLVPQSCEFVLYSDDDIEWLPTALDIMVRFLSDNPQAAYCYGSYQIGNRIECAQEFDPELLRRVNFISTMSLIRRPYCIEFDETLKRFIDWDYWLTLLEQGRTGVYCQQMVFKTAVREGITSQDKNNTRMRKEIIAKKHHLDEGQVL